MVWRAEVGPGTVRYVRVGFAKAGAVCQVKVRHVEARII